MSRIVSTLNGFFFAACSAAKLHASSKRRISSYDGISDVSLMMLGSTAALISLYDSTSPSSAASWWISEIRSRLLNSVRATGFAVATRARQAVTIRSTSLKRASMSSVSLYLSTCYPVGSLRTQNRWSLREPIRIVKQTWELSPHVFAHGLRIERKKSACYEGAGDRV